MRRFATLNLALLTLSLVAAHAAAQPTTQPADPHAMQDLMPNHQEEMMQKMMQLTSPGPRHEHLARKVGLWEHQVKA